MPIPKIYYIISLDWTGPLGSLETRYEGKGMKKSTLGVVAAGLLCALLGFTRLSGLLGYIGLGNPLAVEFMQGMVIVCILFGFVTQAMRDDEEEQGLSAFLLSFSLVIALAAFALSNVPSAPAFWAHVIAAISVAVAFVCAVVAARKGIRPHNG